MAELTKEQLEQAYNLGYEHGKAYANMKAALDAMLEAQKEDKDG